MSREAPKSVAGSIDQQIKRALSVGPVSGGDDLVGFKSDVHHFLEVCELFASVEVKITDDPHCVLEASCVVVDDAASDEIVASMLERIWLEYLRYPAEEAHALGSDREGVSLWFVTRSGHLCMTGRIRALRPPGRARTA
jgi:hypothetical protein